MSYGVPYMGSKAGILSLIRYILDRHYDKKYFIDLFIGGGAVSHYVLERTNMVVFGNDLNKYVVAFLKELYINNGVNFKNKAYDFVSRETFFDTINNPQNYDDWYVGYVSTMWSFGNRGTSYIYGKHIEEEKRIMHQAIVFNDYKEFPFEWRPSDYILDIDYKDNKNKRSDFMREFKLFLNNNYPNYDRVVHLERMERLDIIKHYDDVTTRMQNLSWLERTNKNYNQYEKLVLSSMDWKKRIDSLDKEVLENAIIYCDPPYEDTASYVVGEENFNHIEFWQWFRDTPYCVYVSSYNAPDDIKPLNFEYKINSFNANNRDVMTENLYWNGKGEPIPTMEDLLFGDD